MENKTELQNSNQEGASPAAPQAQVKYAGFWIRWAAYFIDCLVLFIPQAIINGVFSIANFGAMQKVASSLAGFLLVWAYYVYMTNNYQATLGKKALGLKVFSDKLERPTLNQVLLRETVGKIVSMLTLLIGYIMAGFTDRKRALHDMIASTVVVYDDPNKKTPVWIFVVAAILPIIAIFGILASIVLVSLSSARGKAQDAGIKSTLASVNVSALIYADDNNFSYTGYVPQASAGSIACSGQPIVNISTDGKQMAVFMRSCQKSDKYFCGNPETSLITETAEVSESYVKSGATICNSSDITPALP